MLKGTRESEEEDEEDAEERGNENMIFDQSAPSHLQDTPIDPEIGTVMLDKLREFEIPNGCRQGFGVFHADFTHLDVHDQFSTCTI